MTITPEAILEQTEWVRQLAHKLVQDPHLADDLVQETWLAALRQPPDAGSGPRPAASLRRWLATVLRNAVRQDARRDARRRRHEARAARGDAQPSTVSLVERVQAHRTVVECVLGLEDPYREAVILRYFEGLAPRQIAARLGVPATTVHTRLRRALAQLRARLDVRHGGDRAAWCALLAPAASTPWAPPLATDGIVTGVSRLGITTGVALMKAKTLTVSAGAIAIALVVAVAWPWGEDTPPSPDPRPSTPAPLTQQAALDEPATPRGGDARIALPAAAADQRTPPDAAAVDTPTFGGRVLDATARPRAGVGVRLDAGSTRSGRGVERDAPAPTTQSGADGAFRLPVPKAAGAVSATDAQLATVLAARVEPTILQQGVEPCVVVSRACRFEGTVVDVHGAPLEGARVAQLLPQDFRSRFDAVLDYSVEVQRATRTDAAGRFTLQSVGAVRGGRLGATLDGHLPASIEQPPTDAADLRLVLGRPEAGAGDLAGVVLDPHGAPAADAHVALGMAQAVTGPDGRFVLDLERAGEARHLRAMRRGLRPAHRELAVDPAERPGFVTLQLAGPPLQIAGRLVDPRGQPVAGVKVWAHDPAVFGRVGRRGAVSVEGYLGGAPTIDELIAAVEHGTAQGSAGSIGEVLRDNPTAGWAWVRTDTDGAFVLAGLLERDYVLSVLWPDSLARAECGPFPAGSRGLRIVVPAPPVHPVVAGVVVTRLGQPLPGVQVAAVCDAMRLRYEAGGASTAHEGGVRTTTDAAGEFRLENVAAERVYLRLDGERILPEEFGRGVDGGVTAVRGDPADALRIVVAQRVHVRVELVDPSEADAVAFLDQQGARVPINVFTGRGRRTTDTTPFRDGRSDSLTLTDDAVTAVLLRGPDGARVREAPLALRGGELNVVRL